MGTTRSPMTHAPLPGEADRDAIRAQLERMLANPLFRNSKRCAHLLRYVVEHTLDGGSGELKERTLGVEVFGREPDYDTNADPVVRATAGDIRKRIAQYYHEPERQGEIRIDLSPRSYVPEFLISQVPALAPAATTAPVAAPVSAEPIFAKQRGPVLPWLIAGLAIAVAALLSFPGTSSWLKPSPVRTALDRFWGPVLDSSSAVLLCIGQRSFVALNPEVNAQANAALLRTGDLPGSAAMPVSLAQLYYLGSQNVALSDARTLARVTGLLSAKSKSFQILGESATSFSDLRDRPVVLIGALNNDWTRRLMGPLRFGFDRNLATFWISDRQKPERHDRWLSYDTLSLDITEDYGLISRVLDPSTERMVVVAAGLTGYATMAAGEFLTNPAYLEAAVKDAPAGWERNNMQFVFGTKVIKGVSGPPRVLDKYFW